MNTLSKCLLIATLILPATSGASLAAACDVLKGKRYVAFAEGAWDNPGQKAMSTAVFNFAPNVAGSAVHTWIAYTSAPTEVGIAEIVSVKSCTNVAGSNTQATLVYSSEGQVKVMVFEGGKRLSSESLDRNRPLKGWAYQIVP